MFHVTLDQILEWNPQIENPTSFSPARRFAFPHRTCTASTSRSRVPTSSSRP
ncbi:hypothetical protein ACFWJ5_30110 [Streptomyces qaidamensis]|uniref:hypothetical protein n=1 Tax=Streptomyces qaidamensis TaxID=1783515 RepID=UPI0036667458